MSKSCLIKSVSEYEFAIQIFVDEIFWAYIHCALIPTDHQWAPLSPTDPYWALVRPSELRWAQMTPI